MGAHPRTPEPQEDQGKFTQPPAPCIPSRQHSRGMYRLFTSYRQHFKEDGKRLHVKNPNPLRYPREPQGYPQRCTCRYPIPGKGIQPAPAPHFPLSKGTCKFSPWCLAGCLPLPSWLFSQALVQLTGQTALAPALFATEQQTQILEILS